jgi:putative heme transporter
MSRRLLLRLGTGLALAAVVFAVVVPRIAGYGSVAHQLATVSAAWAAALAAAAVVDILTSALPWKVVLPQLSWFGALAFPQASTALTSVLPGGAPLGMAISFGLLRRQRVSAGEAGFAVALTGVFSQLAILVYPLAGAALVFSSGRLSTSTALIAGVSGAVALVGAGGAAAALRSRRAALWLGRAIHAVAGGVSRLLRREPPGWGEEAIARFRDERVAHLRRRWPALTAATLANQLSAYLAFELCLRALGISFHQLPPTETFLAWAVGRLLTSLPLTPAGAGFVELGMIGTLVGFGGPHAHVVAAVLLYRGLIVVPTLAAGLVALLLLRRKKKVPA